MSTSPLGRSTAAAAASPCAIDSCTRQRASAGYIGTPTKLFGVAYRRSMTASGTTVGTSTSPAAFAASDTGGTGGDANAAVGAAQKAVHRATTAPHVRIRTRSPPKTRYVRTLSVPLVRPDHECVPARGDRHERRQRH